MTDPLSITASIASLISLGTGITDIISKIIRRGRSAPSAIKSLNLRLVGLCKALDGFAALLESRPLESLPGFPTDDLSELLENIMGDFKCLQEIVNEYTVKLTDGVIRQRWKKLLWGFQESDVKDLTTNIEAYKATLILTTSFAAISGVSQMTKTTEQIRGQVATFGIELQEVRSLCQQLRDRDLAPSTMSPRKVTTHGSTSSGLTPIATNSSSTSVNTIASSYRAASFIESYCDGIELFCTRTTQDATDVTVEGGREPINMNLGTTLGHTLQRPPDPPLVDWFYLFAWKVLTAGLTPGRGNKSAGRR